MCDEHHLEATRTPVLSQTRTPVLSHTRTPVLSFVNCSCTNEHYSPAKQILSPYMVTTLQRMFTHENIERGSFNKCKYRNKNSINTLDWSHPQLIVSMKIKPITPANVLMVTSIPSLTSPPSPTHAVTDQALLSLSLYYIRVLRLCPCLTVSKLLARTIGHTGRCGYGHATFTPTYKTITIKLTSLTTPFL